jgi:hypothetical protein
MDPANAPSIILPIAILAACGIIAMVMAIIAGVIILA